MKIEMWGRNWQYFTASPLARRTSWHIDREFIRFIRNVIENVRNLVANFPAVGISDGAKRRGLGTRSFCLTKVLAS